MFPINITKVVNLSFWKNKYLLTYLLTYLPLLKFFLTLFKKKAKDSTLKVDDIALSKA